MKALLFGALTYIPHNTHHRLQVEQSIRSQVGHQTHAQRVAEVAAIHGDGSSPPSSSREPRSRSEASPPANSSGQHPLLLTANYPLRITRPSPATHVDSALALPSPVTPVTLLCTPFLHPLQLSTAFLFRPTVSLTSCPIRCCRYCGGQCLACFYLF